NTNYCICLTNNDNDKSRITFEEIITHAFDATKKTLVFCSHEDNKTIINIHDIEKNNTKTINLNVLLKNISIVFNKNNNDFLTHGKNNNESQNFSNEIRVYGQDQVFF